MSRPSHADPSVAATGPGPGPRYDRISIVLHWTTAGLVLLLWGIAQIVDFFPKGEPKIAMRSLHIMLGATLGIVLLTRAAWRIGWGRRLPSNDTGIMLHSAKAMHWTLYVLVAATVVLGVANAWVRGDTITGLFTIPQLAPGDKALKQLVEGLHGTFANAILIAAGLHAAVALLHHFALHDGVLRRMLPSRVPK